MLSNAIQAYFVLGVTCIKGLSCDDIFKVKGSAVNLIWKGASSVTVLETLTKSFYLQ